MTDELGTAQVDESGGGKEPKRNITLAIFALFFAITTFAVIGTGVLTPNKGKNPQLKAPDEKLITPSTEEEQFWIALDKKRPVFNAVERKCFVDDVKFKLNTGDSRQDNAFGGVATDLMKLALTPPDERPGAPRIDLQNYDQLLGTCPQCGATYFDIDFVNINTGRPALGASKLQLFDLGKELPELAAKPKDKWTFDERTLARYITQRVAGFPHTELGYTALAGAYNGNLSIGIGRDFSLTPAAFYALAAAEFKLELDGKTYDNPEVGSLMALALAELYRLLGSKDDAIAAFKLARSIGGLPENTKSIISHLEGLTAKGDFSLQRQPLPGELRPPLGWYIDTILPGANAELDVARSEWSRYDSPDDVLAAMRKTLAN